MVVRRGRACKSCHNAADVVSDRQALRVLLCVID
jgi:hypothetical protein